MYALQRTQQHNCGTVQRMPGGQAFSCHGGGSCGRVVDIAHRSCHALRYKYTHSRIDAMAAGGGATTMREGDWICPKCANHNYKSKTSCNKCHIPKDGVPIPTAADLRPGDWICPSCNNHNYKSKTVCNKCHKAPPAGASVQPEDIAFVAEARPGDWMCATPLAVIVSDRWL